MDIDEDTNVVITATDEYDVEYPSFESPRTIGDNGFWPAASTMDMTPFENVKMLKICFPGSGAVTFIHFQACV